MKYTRFHNMSFKNQLVLIIISVSAFALILGLLIYSIYDFFNYKRELKYNASLSATLVSESCIAALSFGYKDEAFTNLKVLDAIPDILNACIYDKDNNVFAYYDKNPEVKIAFPSPVRGRTEFSGKFLNVFKPIMQDKEKTGTVYLRISTEPLKDKIIGNTIIFFLLLFLLGGPVYLMASKLQGLVSEPILNLAEVANSMSHNKDFSIRVSTNRKGSIGVLYHRFNEMMEHIQESQREINKADSELRILNEELEERVRLRTSELEKAKLQAESADRLKSAFLAAMSHELRTPLNSIIGFTGILLKGLAGPLNEEQSKQLRMAKGSGQHLLALINDILDISKIEAGELVVSFKQFDMHKSLSNIIDVIKPLADKKNLELRSNISPEVSMITSDQRRVEQVFLNIINNAVKFTETGYVELNSIVQDNMIITKVIDTGIGIDDCNLDKLFKPFSQIDTGLTRNYDGTGLGLSISKRLLDKLGGTISITSLVNQGSTFTVILPIEGVSVS